MNNLLPHHPPRLIVLSGEAGAGKDAVADILERSYDWEKFSLSAPMKRFCADMFGFTHEQLYGPSSARNAPDPRWARPCQCCKGSGRWVDKKDNVEACETCEGSGKINDNSPRRILQLMGEEFLRQMVHVDALTMAFAPGIKQALQYGKKIVVNDARNDNDRDNLHKWLGARRVDVRSTRTKDKQGIGWRAHASENRQPTDDQLEFIIRNDEEWPFPSLAGKVDEMLVTLYDGLW